MTTRFEELLAGARQARSDQMKRLVGLALSALARDFRRVRTQASGAAIGPLMHVMQRLGPEDRPGC